MLRKLRRERNNIFYKKLHLALALASAMRYKVSVATNKEAHTMHNTVANACELTSAANFYEQLQELISFAQELQALNAVAAQHDLHMQQNVAKLQLAQQQLAAAQHTLTNFYINESYYDL